MHRLGSIAMKPPKIYIPELNPVKSQKWNHKVSVMYDKHTLHKKVTELGKKITTDYDKKDLYVVGVLKGSFVFYADLVRQIDLPLKCDFIQVSSYNGEMKSSGVISLKKDLQYNIKGKHVILVEDIIDTGMTMNWLLHTLSIRLPASLRVCTLLEKPDQAKVHIPIDYVGFQIKNEFVVGYGLDFDEEYRNLPYIGTYKED
jgi:hypoxanthine phosphoribosyltransferase